AGIVALCPQDRRGGEGTGEARQQTAAPDGALDMFHCFILPDPKWRQVAKGHRSRRRGRRFPVCHAEIPARKAAHRLALWLAVRLDTAPHQYLDEGEG